MSAEVRTRSDTTKRAARWVCKILHTLRHVIKCNASFAPLRLRGTTPRWGLLCSAGIFITSETDHYISTRTYRNTQGVPDHRRELGGMQLIGTYRDKHRN